MRSGHTTTLHAGYGTIRSPDAAAPSGPTAPTGPTAPAGPSAPARATAPAGSTGPSGVAQALPPALGAPGITGTLALGETLTAVSGALSGGPADATTYQWQHGTGGSWSDIAGATETTYSPTRSDEGDALRVVETATKSAGAVAAPSAPTATVPSEDAEAEALVIKAASEVDAWGAGNGGSYANLSIGVIQTIDPSIPVHPDGTAFLSMMEGTSLGYTLGATSTNGDVFSVIRGPGNSSLLYTCSSLSGNGCPASHEWTP